MKSNTMKIKSLFVTALLAATLFTVTACGGRNDTTVTDTTVTDMTVTNSTVTDANQDADDNQEEMVQIPNPWMEYSSLEEATKAAGFEMTAPTEMEGCSTVIQVLNSEMIEVSFFSENDEKNIYIRKSTLNEDISGDYNEYSEQNEVQVGEVTVTEKGNDGLVSVATWSNGGYTYCIDAAGLSPEEMAALIQQVQ